MSNDQSTNHEAFSITSSAFTDKHKWEEVVKAKLSFLQAGCVGSGPPIVRPEIFDSWKRSCSMGIDMEAKNLSCEISDGEYATTYKRFRPLIEEAKPLLAQIKQLDLDNDYIFELITDSGTSVLQIGDYERHFYISERSVFNERTMGTNAHSLCMRHKKPIVIVGPEHYCNALRNLAAIAAPILDKDGTAVASLLLIQDLPEDPWLESYRKLLSNTMGLISSIASSIESRAKFTAAKTVLEDIGNRFQTIKFASQRSMHMFEAALSSSPDIIFAMQTDGSIEQFSPGAAQLAKTQHEELYGKHVDELFGNGFFAKLKESEAKSQQPLVTIHSKRFTADMSTVPGTQKGHQDGYILRLTSQEKAIPAVPRSKSEGAATLFFDDILGESAALKATIGLAKRYAPTMENILINGESGTGKEYFAQAIHNETRPNGPFISLNCAAIPAHLIESELFGYEAGSFTGADKKGSPGKIELAQGGTLFLDEIGDMPLDLQATLLRVIENKQVMRIGGKGYKQVDFRILAATNRDLMDMVNQGTFREDLLYRLSILTLSIPPLRERNGDQIFFAKHYLAMCLERNPGGPTKISENALNTIEGYHWPGNVRQLKNAMFSAYYSATTDTIERGDLPAYITEGTFNGATPPLDASDTGDLLSSVSARNPGGLSLQKLEESAIKLALLHANSNVTKAADLLQISKATLYRKIKDYEITLR